MTPSDLRPLRGARFRRRRMRGGKRLKQGRARRASEFAGHIEEYCRITEPEAFEQKEEEDMQVVDLISTESEGKFGPAQRMATAIVEIYRERGDCLPQDLLSKGFTNDEIDRQWAMAKALAYVELNTMDS